MHGQFYQNLERTSVDKENPLALLLSLDLKGEAESLIKAAQDQALNMRYHQWNIMKQPTDSECRMCYKAEEHTKHTVAGRTIFAPSDYTNRHNKVASYIHWMIHKYMGLQGNDKYYEHIANRVIKVNSTTSMWDVLVMTDQKY
jgi:hypothetical protein